MRFRLICLLLILVLFACQKEQVIKETVAEHPYWPLQKYAKWIYLTGTTEREVVLSPEIKVKPAYYTFVKKPFPAFAGLRLNQKGELELLWSYLNVITTGVLLPKNLSSDSSSWYSKPAFVDNHWGSTYDSLRFQVEYAGFIPSYTPSPGPSPTYTWLVDLTINTELWHKQEGGWVIANLPEYRLLLDENKGPVAIRNGSQNLRLFQALER